MCCPDWLRPALHLVLHIAVPAAVARIAFTDRWQRAWLVMAATVMVDLDHLAADPIYDPGRCSIGFHPLHRWPAVPVYLAMAVIAPSRLIGLGLLVHMALDAVDCLWMAL